MQNVKINKGKLSTYAIIDDKNVIISDRKPPGGIGHASLEDARRVTELRYAKAVSAPLLR
jgi:hypothetical protein